MKKFYILFITIFISASSFGQQNDFTINEILEGSSGFVEISCITTAITPTGWNLEISTSLFDPSPIIFSLDGYDLSSETSDGRTLIFINVDLLNKSYILLRDGSDVTELFSIGGGSGTGSIGGVPVIGLGVAGGTKSHQKTDAGWITASPSTPGAINTGQSTLPVAKNQIAGFAMYPNPVTNGTFSITSNNSIEKNIEIFSVSGQQVYKSSVKSRENIDISNLTTGSYFIRVEEEGKTATRKLIVN